MSRSTTSRVTVPDGSLTALLGPSGSGKSTLLRVIAGLETPDSGTVLIEGEDVTTRPARTRGVGFVLPALRRVQAHDRGQQRRVRARRAQAAEGPRRRPRWRSCSSSSASRHLGERYPSQLSGGQRQRMALARALAVEPQRAAARRAVRRARRAGARGAAPLAAPPARRRARDDDLRHARPGGGDGDLRADRRRQRGPDRAVGVAGRDLRPSREPVRHGLRRAGHARGRRAGAPARRAGADRAGRGDASRRSSRASGGSASRSASSCCRPRASCSSRSSRGPRPTRSSSPRVRSCTCALTRLVHGARPASA